MKRDSPLVFLLTLSFFLPQIKMQQEEFQWPVFGDGIYDVLDAQVDCLLGPPFKFLIIQHTNFSVSLNSLWKGSRCWGLGYFTWDQQHSVGESEGNMKIKKDVKQSVEIHYCPGTSSQIDTEMRNRFSVNLFTSHIKCFENIERRNFTWECTGEMTEGLLLLRRSVIHTWCTSRSLVHTCLGVQPLDGHPSSCTPQCGISSKTKREEILKVGWGPWGRNSNIWLHVRKHRTWLLKIPKLILRYFIHLFSLFSMIGDTLLWPIHITHLLIFTF